MTASLTSINAGDYLALAKVDADLWKKATLFNVEHVEYGPGSVISISEDGKYIHLKFDSDTDSCKFNVNSLENGKTTFLVDSVIELELHEQLVIAATERAERKAIAAKERAERDAAAAEKMAQERRKEEARNEVIRSFKSLAAKYDAPLSLLFDGNHVSPLGVVLEKLDANESVEEFEIDWLIEKDQHRLVALVYYRGFRIKNDPWELIKCCKHLRRAKLPSKVLDLVTTERIKPITDARILSALITTRGGAHRDLSDLSSAKQDALIAIKTSPQSYHPHNLLGAVLYEEGYPEAGDRAFERALELGSTSRTQDFEIRNALKRSSEEARQTIVAYLLNKDPQRYSWASSVSAMG